MKALLFLYPINEYFDSIIECDAVFHKFNTEGKRKDREFLKRFEKAKTNEEKERIQLEGRKFREDSFRANYKNLLNRCIDVRYRQQGFSINYALFDGHTASNMIDFKPGDSIVRVGIDFVTHVLEKKYPKPDVILNQLRDVTKMHVAGFHRQDCVDKVARRAHERGLSVLVDEDLTESFGYLSSKKTFNMKKGPNFKPREVKGSGYLEGFMASRRGKPWLWQEY